MTPEGFTGDTTSEYLSGLSKAEELLNLPKHPLDAYKNIVLDTVHKYYETHGKKPLQWILTPLVTD